MNALPRRGTNRYTSLYQSGLDIAINNLVNNNKILVIVIRKTGEITV